MKILILFVFLVVGCSETPPPHVTARVGCTTTKGELLIELYRNWSPLGADRFLELVRDGFFTDIAFFRSVRGFLTQFGISDRAAMKHWHNKNIPDDPNLHIPIRKNYLSYAGGGPHTRSTQLFIAFEDLDFLGKEPWETPFGAVVEGQSTLDKLYKDYGDIPPFGAGPDQQKLHNRGNAYIRQEFPNTDFILSCREISDAADSQRELRQKNGDEQAEIEDLEEGEEEQQPEEEGVEQEQQGEEEEEEGEEEGEGGEEEETTGEVAGEIERERDVEGEIGGELEEVEEGEESEEGEDGEEAEEEDPEEAASSPPAVTLLAIGLFVGISITYCSIRRHKAAVAEGKGQ